MKFATIELNHKVHPIIAVDEKKPKLLNDVLNSPKKNNGKRKKKSNNLKEGPNDVGGRKNKRRAK